jgi:hypothetical protein
VEGVLDLVRGFNGDGVRMRARCLELGAIMESRPETMGRKGSKPARKASK